MARSQRPDVVILDVLMPVMNGRDMFLRLKEDGLQRPPVLILSAYDAERERRELGAEASLEKPFTPEDLLDAVERLIREHPLEAPDFSRQSLDLRNWQVRYPPQF
jgi:DNA-binding response OmpR family regulator